MEAQRAVLDAGGGGEGHESTELEEVIALYLSLFENDCNRFKYFLAPNSVVDWFGRSIRGVMKIHEYLRLEVTPQFEHLEFKDFRQSAAIEYKPLHMKTKIISTVEVDQIHPRNRVPAVGTLRTRADSDVEENPMEDEDVEMLCANAAGNKTPQRLNNTCIEDLTPPASANKEETSAAPAEPAHLSEGNSLVGVSGQKRKYPTTPTKSAPFQHLRSLTSLAKKTAVKKKTTKSLLEGLRSLYDDTSSEEDEEEVEAAKSSQLNEESFSELRYLEATGVLRSKLQQHRKNDAADTGASWDRQVRIRISYRRRCEDDQIQFALVLYEHLMAPGATPAKTATRRNLMTEFNRALLDDDDDSESSDSDADPEEPLPVIPPVPAVAASAVLPSSEEIAAALESSAFANASLPQTPTKSSHTPPPTPKRKPPRTGHGASLSSSKSSMSGLKRLNLSLDIPPPKRSAARCLRL